MNKKPIIKPIKAVCAECVKAVKAGWVRCERHLK